MRRVLSAAGVVLLTVALALPAAAQSGERITNFSVALDVLENGDLKVTENIEYDFGTAKRHGIFRNIPVRFDYDDRYERIYPLDQIEVSGGSGTPDQYEQYTEGRDTVLKIGDPDSTITGKHRYRIAYRIQGALNGFDDHIELYWNAVGHGWNVPVQNAYAAVSMPVPILQVACFAGPERSTQRCQGAGFEGREATFSEQILEPYESLTVVVSIPAGSVDRVAPVLDERWSFARAFQVTPATAGGALAILVAILAWIYTNVMRRGRDRRFAGSPVDAALAASGPEEPVGLLERTPVPVEYLPPDGLRPGLIGTLVDEKAHTLDVVATIVDLAVRGYLRIDEVPKEGWFGKADWWLIKLRDDEEGLMPYESLLLGSIFSAGQREVMLSQLEDKFASKLRAVQDALYKETVKQGWFRSRPDNVRAAWTVIGVLALLLSLGVLIVMAIFTKLALLAVPLPIGAILILLSANRMPSRTARGTAVVRRVRGFRRFIEESEAPRAEFAERKNLFSDYLPYAIVFGATKRWAKRFEGLDGQLPETTWYTGVHGHHFTTSAFASSMNGFATTTAGTITSTPSSSGSSGFGGGGFSGGGGGGGGGGSW